jgi:hypothetical protein
MEHPFITDFSTLDDDTLIQRISDLNTRLNWYMRNGKGDVARQISMAIASYQGEYNRRQSDKAKDSNNYQHKIDIK